jgi:hypothetical protein
MWKLEQNETTVSKALLALDAANVLKRMRKVLWRKEALFKRGN